MTELDSIKSEMAVQTRILLDIRSALDTIAGHLAPPDPQAALFDGLETTNGLAERWDQLFDKGFLQEYPRRIATQAARKAWRRQCPDTRAGLRNRYGAIMGRLMERKQGEWAGRSKDKIPYPATWLNAEEFDG